MLKKLRNEIISALWDWYLTHAKQMQAIKDRLAILGIHELPLDHFAIIDLPGSYSGIPTLSHIFSLLGFKTRGRDYLPSKQNEFLWMAEVQSSQMQAIDVLPQVVVADFRLEAMPVHISRIIEKYAQQSIIFDFAYARELVVKAENGDLQSYARLKKIILEYLTQRGWELPTIAEYQTVAQFNELLAWVLVFGKQPNHFTLSLHLLAHFNSIEAFQLFLEDEMHITLNAQGGKIKGSQILGMQQGSTQGEITQVCLNDGHINAVTHFVEFVWRHPRPGIKQPIRWSDYYNDFIAQQANHVIESLHTLKANH